VAAVKVAWAAHLSALFDTPTGVVMPLGVGETSATTTTETRFLDPQTCPFTGHRAASSCVRSTAFRTTHNRLFLSEQQLAARPKVNYRYPHFVQVDNFRPADYSRGAPNLRAFVPNPTERLPRAPTEFAAADPGVRAGSLSRSLQ
jgi:hypothetical protein